MRFGVVVFPGTWSDTDTHHVLSEVFHRQVEYVWHKETDLSRFDCVILPGGFSYGDYLRCGAIARFSPVMGAVTDFADGGGIVAGICNGFQILCEAGLLPGALMRNDVLQFRCMWVNLRSETAGTPFSGGYPAGQVLRVPISHGEGRYFADPDTLRELEEEGRVVFRYSTDDGQLTPGFQPERVGQQHRGHRQCQGQRSRHDAASRAVLRAGRGRHRRGAHLQLDHRPPGLVSRLASRPTRESNNPCRRLAA